MDAKARKPHSCGFFCFPDQRLQRYILLIFSLACAPATHAAWQSPETIEGATTINTSEARDKFDNGAIFVDVRSLRQFNKRHIPGAYHLELNSDFTPENLQKLVNKDEPVILYCNGPHCSLSYKAVMKAVRWGFTNILYYREGFRTWRKSNNPIEKVPQ